MFAIKLDVFISFTHSSAVSTRTRKSEGFDHLFYLGNPCEYLDFRSFVTTSIFLWSVLQREEKTFSKMGNN